MSKKIAENLPGTAKLAAIRFLVLDVDGVMTDGSISYDSAGHEQKTFNVKDGAGLGYWKQAGHEAGIITGRSSPMLERRARELGIRFVAMGAPEKMPAFEKMLAEAGVAPEETAVVGDDLPDLPLIRRAGFGVAVADAAAEARLEADWVARQNGGRGAVREVIELILKARGEWDGVLARHR